MGVARSGTTALARLLNCNRNFAVGVERYIKYRSKLEDQMFLKEVFFNFETYNCTKGSRALAEALYDRYDTAIAVGDKIPPLYDCMLTIAPRFSDVTFVVITRDPLDIARSWNGRAAKTSGWPAWKRDVLSAVEHQLMWTNLLGYEYPERVILLDYDAAYDEDIAAFIIRLANEFDVAPDINSAAVRSMIARTKARQDRGRAAIVSEASARIVMENVFSGIRQGIKERGGVCRLSNIAPDIRAAMSRFYAERKGIYEIATAHLLQDCCDDYRGPLLAFRGWHRLRSGRAEEASSDFQAALRYSPGNPAANRGLNRVQRSSRSL